MTSHQCALRQAHNSGVQWNSSGPLRPVSRGTSEVFETAVESNQAVVPKACEKRNIRGIRKSCRVEPGGGPGLNSW